MILSIHSTLVELVRLHLSRYIPIASTFKARQLLSICHSSSSLSASTSTTNDANTSSFGSRVHSLLLLWPDQGKYSTRRSSVITKQQFKELLLAFNALRSIEFGFLPFPRLEDEDDNDTGMIQARLASIGSFDNIRSLNFHNTPNQLRKELFSIIPDILSLSHRLERLSIKNIPLNAVESIIDKPAPSCRLKSLDIVISSARVIEPDLLEWILQSTIEAKSCKSLRIWLSKKCTDIYNEYSESIVSVKEDEGFQGLSTPLSKLSPSLTRLSLLGLRTGQAAEIISKTTSNLKILEIYDTFGFGNDLLNDLPLPSGLEMLGLYPNPSWEFGANEIERRCYLLGDGKGNISSDATTVTMNATASGSSGGHANATAGNKRNSNIHRIGNALWENAANTGTSTSRWNSQRNSSTGNANSTATTSRSSKPGASLSSTSGSSDIPTTANQSTSSQTTAAPPEETTHHTFIEIPISTHSFLSELGPGNNNRLEKLKVVRVPENARFGKRGKWLNLDLRKKCRKFGVSIEEIRMAESMR